MLRVGLDLVDVAEVAASLDGPHAAHYLERVYTTAEVEDCRGRGGELQPQRLAARFAAKEAAIKALPGAGEGVPLSAIEVVRAADGAVSLRLHGRAAELFEELGASEVALSISHERGIAAAAVLMA